MSNNSSFSSTSSSPIAEPDFPLSSDANSECSISFPERAYDLSVEQLPLFNIEKYGDPRIDWKMYYKFKVQDGTTFYELEPGYLETPKFPRHRYIDPVPGKSGGRDHLCRVPFCTAKPFKRYCDLDRHFKSVHCNIDFICDYKKCPHDQPFRKDHAREHYREYHQEDLVKRNDPRVQEFISKRTDYIRPAWWRCTACLSRVKTREYGYVCSNCRHSCEPERVAARQRIEEEQRREKGERGDDNGEGLLWRDPSISI